MMIEYEGLREDWIHVEGDSLAEILKKAVLTATEYKTQKIADQIGRASCRERV